MSYRPMFLDGPWRGRVAEIESFPFMVSVIKEFSLTGLWMENPTLAIEAEPFDVIVYYKHYFKFGHRCLVVASVNPAQPNFDDAFDLMLSDYAKRSEYT